MSDNEDAAANDPDALADRVRSLVSEPVEPGERMPSEAELEAGWRHEVIDRLAQADRRNAELVELQGRQSEALRGIAGALRLLQLCTIVAVLAILYVALR